MRARGPGSRASQRPIGQIPDEGRLYWSCVYFAVDHATGFIKIGKTHTGHLLERVREHERILSRPVTLLAYRPGDYAEEHALHRDFKPDQVRGEWFRPSKQLDEVIKSATPAPAGIAYWGEWAWFR